MASGGRYYSQSYDLVDNPANNTAPSHPTPLPVHSAVNDADYEDYSNYQKQNPDHDDFDLPPRPAAPRRSQGRGWSLRRKIVIWGGVALLVILIIAAIAGGVSASKKGDGDNGPWTYVPFKTDAKVTSQLAFGNGSATNNILDQDGVAGKDEYVMYSGDWKEYPEKEKWITFERLYYGNLANMETACEVNKVGKNNSPAEQNAIWAAVQALAAQSFVDHRFILAVILQESAGCVRVGETVSNGHLTQVTNPGLMQSHNGTGFNSNAPNASIFAMVQDGTQGTQHGDGLVQNLNYYGNLFWAARGYNSGFIPDEKNLSAAGGATECYVNDIANRLTGWANATSLCH
ncbi:hypothetical protein LTR95_016152 [Oleoguttula sp. CCFEE 5521]